MVIFISFDELSIVQNLKTPKSEIGAQCFFHIREVYKMEGGLKVRKDIIEKSESVLFNKSDLSIRLSLSYEQPLQTYSHLIIDLDWKNRREDEVHIGNLSSFKVGLEKLFPTVFIEHSLKRFILENRFESRIYLNLFTKKDISEKNNAVYCDLVEYCFKFISNYNPEEVFEKDFCYEILKREVCDY